MDSRISDSDLVTALAEAGRLYKYSRHMTRQQRFDSIVSIAEWDLFTVGQIAQLAGVSTSTIYGMKITKLGYGSGKFNPMSIDTLTQLLFNRMNGAPLNKVLLQAAVDEGNSQRVIYKFTGISPSTIGRKLKHDTESSDL